MFNKRFLIENFKTLIYALIIAFPTRLNSTFPPLTFIILTKIL